MLFCARIWDLGITNVDDALWSLWIHQPDKHPAVSFARDQGRFWGFGGGSWIILGLSFFGTFLGNLMVVGSFVLFFVLFVRLVSVYWSAPAAFSAAGLFLALFAFRADRSILYAYPLFFWMPASAIASAILLARRYQLDGGWLSLWSSALLLLVGLFNNEGAIVLSVTVFAAAVLVNHRHALDRVGPARRRGRFRIAATLYAVIVAAFAIASVIWRLQHPTPYSGNTLAPFDAGKIATTLFSFVTSGTLLYDFAHPYVQTFYDTLLDRAVRVVYAPGRYLGVAAANPVSLVAGVLAACLLGQALSRRAAISPVALAAGIVAGLVVATLPLLPVAMTVQYQSWFTLYDAHAYSHTIFATFGLALSAACLLRWLLQALPLPVWGRTGLAWTVALVLGGFAMLGNQMNDAIAHDFRPEGARWRVLGELVKMSAATGVTTGTILVPRLRNGSWFAMMPPEYWSDYARDVLGSRLRFSDHQITLQDLAQGAAYADYQLERDGRHMAITLAHVASGSAAAPPVADRITVLIERPFDPATIDRILAFDDPRGGLRQIPLRDMTPVGKGVWTVAGIQAAPNSARILDTSTMPHLLVECGASAPLGVPLVMAKTMPAGSGCLAAGYLTRGWFAPETTTTWSSNRTAVIDLPLDGPPPPKLRLRLDASSFTGMGFYAAVQTVRLRIKGRDAAMWEFRPGLGPAAADRRQCERLVTRGRRPGAAQAGARIRDRPALPAEAARPRTRRTRAGPAVALDHAGAGGPKLATHSAVRRPKSFQVARRRLAASDQSRCATPSSPSARTASMMDCSLTSSSRTCPAEGSMARLGISAEAMTGMPAARLSTGGSPKPSAVEA